MAKIIIDGNTMIGVSTGLSIPANSSAIVDFTNNKLIGVQTAILERDEPGLLESLGLPADTPTELVIEVLRAIKERKIDTAEEGASYLKESKLWTYIERSSNSASVIGAIVSFASVVIGIPPTW